MKKRQFNKKLYDKYDKKAKLTLKKVIETNSSFTLVGDINSEHYKVCDLVFNKGDQIISFENEVRENFDEIITNIIQYISQLERKIIHRSIMLFGEMTLINLY